MTNSVNLFQIYPTLPSTNSYGKELIAQGCVPGTVVWALQQTAGRGRRGRSWDGDQSSLTFSVLQIAPQDFSLGILPLTVGLGLVKSLRTLVPDLKIKWPNDLMVGERKLGGILAESVIQEGERWVILGVGLNVNKPHSPFRGEPISLQDITNCQWPRLGILDLALSGIELGFSLAQESGQELSYLFRKYGNFLDRTITVIQGEECRLVIAKEVLADGRLLVEGAQGQQVLLPDEISVRFS